MSDLPDLHWTYTKFQPGDDLHQGDIIGPSEDLKAIFKEVHPHFTAEKYLAFLVLTQSCDLFRREGACSTRYINVAVVRSLAEVAQRFVETQCDPIRPGIYSSKARDRVYQMFDRIFNQNETKMGLFFLHNDAGIGLGEHAVAFLRVSVAFRSDHYSTIVAARRGRLQSDFENKLGWLVGNLYSRVGTRDLMPTELKDLRKQCLGLDQSIKWVDENRVQRLIQAGFEIDKMDEKQLLDSRLPKNLEPREIGIDRVMMHLQDIFPQLAADRLDAFRSRLGNDPLLKAAFKS